MYKITETLLSGIWSLPALQGRKKKRHKKNLFSIYLFKDFFFSLVLCGLKMLEGGKEKFVDKNVNT